MITRVRKESYQRWFTVNLDVLELPADVLSSEAKIFWQYLFSRPENWEYKRQAAINLLGSGHKVDKATAELKAIQLLEINRIRENGCFKGYDWIVKAVPVLNKVNQSPCPDNQDTVGKNIASPYPDRPDPVSPDPAIQDTLKEIPGLKEKTVLKEQTAARAQNAFAPESEGQALPESKPNLPKNPDRAPAVHDINDPPKNKADAIIQRLMALGFGDLESERIYNRYREQVEIQLDWLPHRNPEKPRKILMLALSQGWEAPKAVIEIQAEQKRKEAPKQTAAELDKIREMEQKAKAERSDPDAQARARAAIEEIKRMKRRAV